MRQSRMLPPKTERPTCCPFLNMCSFCENTSAGTCRAGIAQFFNVVEEVGEVHFECISNVGNNSHICLVADNVIKVFNFHVVFLCDFV